MGVITAIEPQKRNKGRYNLYVDNKFRMGLDEDVVIKFSFEKGKTIDDEYLNDVVKAEENAKAFNRALNLLSFRSRSVGEIVTKLKTKGYEDDSINHVVEKLKENGYLDDYSFGKQLVKDKQNFRKAGKGLVKQELYRKHISKDLSNQLIDELVSDEDEYKRALILAREKSERYGEKEDYKAKYRKLTGLLGRRGYSFTVISKVLKEVLPRY